MILNKTSKIKNSDSTKIILIELEKGLKNLDRNQILLKNIYKMSIDYIENNKKIINLPDDNDIQLSMFDLKNIFNLLEKKEWDNFVLENYIKDTKNIIFNSILLNLGKYSNIDIKFDDYSFTQQILEYTNDISAINQIILKLKDYFKNTEEYIFDCNLIVNSNKINTYGIIILYNFLIKQKDDNKSIKEFCNDLKLIINKFYNFSDIHKLLMSINDYKNTNSEYIKSFALNNIVANKNKYLGGF